jgi:hypothetical protein
MAVTEDSIRICVHTLKQFTETDQGAEGTHSGVSATHSVTRRRSPKIRPKQRRPEMVDDRTVPVVDDRTLKEGST